MATPGRSENTALARWPISDLLEQEPYLFEFFQAIRLMSRIEPERQVVGRFNNPSAEVVRFAANPDVSFPASEIQSLELREGEPPLMRVNFMGLHGPQGILPRAYCELVNERIRARDTTLRDFFDLFNHRIVSLFYQAWEKFHFEIPYERGELDRFSHYVLALLGLDTPGLQNRQDVADDSLLFYGGLLSMHSRSATGLRQVLWDYFNVPVEIEQFVGAWYAVDEESQCSLGENGDYSEQLGLGAVVGHETWDQQSRVRIQLGPLTLEQYMDFLPGHEGHRAVALADAVLCGRRVRYGSAVDSPQAGGARLRVEAAGRRGLATGLDKLDKIGGSLRRMPVRRYWNYRIQRGDHMASTLKSIVAKLNDTMRGTLEGAAGLCLARTHYDVEIEHFLTKLLDASGTDFAGIIQHFGVDKARLAGELGRSLDGIKTGNARTPAFSPSLMRMLREAWTIGSLEFGAGQVRSGAAILALVSDEELSRLVLDVSKEFRKIEAEALRKVLPAILADSREYTADADEAPASGAGAAAPGATKAGGKTQNLDQYTVNLTENARKGKIDTVLGRDFEIRQMVDILTRRRQNNPILTGEAGVGKTAVVEGFAQRLVDGRRAGESAQRNGADAGSGAVAGRRGN